MDKIELWNRCVDFHGHECGGLAIGFKASLYAMELLGLDFSKDEEVVCVTENDACGVDAIQFILGCSVGKGNLIFRLRGKQAFSIYNRRNGKSIRLVLKSLPDIGKEERKQYLLDAENTTLFDVKETTFELPEKAKLFKNVRCECCKELTAESMIRLDNGKQLCLECFGNYTRFY
ncbi:FmdE family protein [Anaerosacchariphilus polymeriproducens]|uniref:Formylmethanofuran dehydrogenase n=1 Tax=Anaerosacchariphilus polymeriproducens TaxID=1812858 RepID=A0A371AYT1_9FIRM|nr:FmdE family protein [Anaerosacchariphilus polymeriproducens]RDU24716.1 formylmethanofuran dehydrogenase [Anaerosacchariphilus polymeriproducens]